LRITDTDGDGSLSQSEIDACLDVGHLDINGGGKTGTPVPSGSGCSPNAAWDAVFGSITKDQMRALSDAQAAIPLDQSTSPKRSVYWVDSGSNWHDSLGTPTEPVILIFSDSACSGDCPKVNGSPTIYGTVYLDSQCDKSKVNGWGGATIHGSVIIESDMEKLNSNTEIHHNPKSSAAFPKPMPDTVSGNDTQRVSGSWKDF
jgi:hypothetical protein